ncbi:TPA: class I SAM-dependent methyltransferase [bacterium]|nr:class I SAM-dependent methyltransferase [bacterium]
MTVTCDICKSTKIAFHHRYYQFPVIVCNSCGFIRAREIPSDSELKNYYSRYFYEEDVAIDKLTRKRYLSILDRLEFVRKTNKIIDFGCGTGLFLQVAKERGWDIIGVEISEMAIQHLGKKNIPYLISDIPVTLYEQFDAVICIEVIEHVVNPIQTIDMFSKLLRSGGYLYLTTPNISTISLAWMKRDYLITYPEHLSYFTVDSLNHLLKNCFRPFDIRTTGLSPLRKKGTRDNVGTYVYDIAMYRKKSEGNVLMRLVKRIFNIILNVTRKGDSIKVFAEKK